MRYVNLWFNCSRPNDTGIVEVYREINASSMMENLTLTNVYEEHPRDVVVSTVAESNHDGCYLICKIVGVWATGDANDHQLNYTAELVYEDENNTLRRVNVPINIGLFTNKNNDFDTAKEIGLGVYDPVPALCIWSNQLIPQL